MAQRHPMVALSFHASGGDSPHASVQVDLGPSSADGLLGAHRRQDGEFQARADMLSRSRKRSMKAGKSA